MDGIIEVKVNGHTISKDNDCAGVQGDANSTKLRITFAENWDIYGKKITFWDALGQNPVRIQLGTNLIENVLVDDRVYLVPIPPEAMAEAGYNVFVIEGVVDGAVKRTVEDKLKVKASRIADNAGEPTSPTPDEAAQLRLEIDAIKGDIVTAKSSAVEAAGSATVAANSAAQATESKNTAVEAKESAEASASKAEKAKDSIEGMTVTVESIGIGEGATVEKTIKDDAVNLHFGMPRAEPGVRVSDEEPAEEEVLVWIAPSGESNEDEYVLESELEIALKTKADMQTPNGGFVAGQGATANALGVAIGTNAQAIGNGAAVGVYARAKTGGAVGRYANTEEGGAVGTFSVSKDGFAGGSCAKTVDSNDVAIDAVQLGTGTNGKEKTLQVYDYRVTDYEKGKGGFLADVGKLEVLRTKTKSNIVEAINEHVLDANNPHQVTARQVGATTEADVMLLIPQSDIVKELNFFVSSLGGEVGRLDGGLASLRRELEGIQKQINEEAHFRGYLSTNEKIQALEATPNDFAYSAESGTKWVYDAESGWQDTGTPVPDQLTPASDATPLADGVATPGTANEYARGDHRHPTDTTRVSVEEFNALKCDIERALNEILAIQASYIGGEAE